MAKKRIGELLVEAEYVTLEQVNQALEIQKTRGERICSILIDLGHLREEEFFEFMSEASRADEIDISGYEIDEAVLCLIPAEAALRLEVIPIGRIGDALTLAMVCPIDEKGFRELEEITGLRIRPVLCSREAVHHALERYFSDPTEAAPGYHTINDITTLEGSMKLRRIGKFVEEIEELPTLPDVLTQISSIVNDPRSSASDLSKAIATDASLSAKILKVANSAAYAFLREIDDIQQAVTLLGFQETQALALSVSIFDHLTDLTELEFKEYWNHSFKCATLSRLISINLISPRIEGAFVAGLLHDMGKVALSMSMRGKQDKVNSLCSVDGIDLLEAEEKIFGLTHAEAGYLMAEHWLLPIHLATSIRYHHVPKIGNEIDEFAAIVYLADNFCKVDASKPSEKLPMSNDVLEVLESLKLSESALQRALKFYSHMIPEPV